MIEIFLLSLIQGITEFLPISSSSHLIIFSNLTDFKDQSLSIDISLHIGSFLAVITYFHKDLRSFIKNKILFFKILIASLPVMIFGFFLIQTGLIDKIRNIEVIGWATLIFGILLYISDKFKLEKNININLSYKNSIFIGLFQILSLIPGVSRSGISITAARLLNFKRFDAAKISFLLSIPTLGAVSVFGVKNLITSEDVEISILNIISIFLSFMLSLVTINYFLKYIKRFSLNIFVLYRIILGITLLSLAYL
ncbi:undecaprenyl-diphosphate phosphatase [Pelagibacteraceae bacterium]|nr:undecaprenyl-diphosphate phosphatase [Pelagibacteraceae bacterium]|tara:strand:+ start:164 stop:922 length:759 start_codon:yes stop_codon:yes gene_type:complete